MPRGQKKAPEDMTAAEELLMVLQWAEQMDFQNIAAALRRIIGKLSLKGSFAQRSFVLPIQCLNRCNIWSLPGEPAIAQMTVANRLRTTLTITNEAT